MRLIGQLPAARDRTRVLSQQNADEVLLLLDAGLEIRDRRSGAIDELFRLADVEQRGRSARLEELCRMLSAREACGLGHSRLESGIVGMEYRFFKKVRSPSSAL